jgi:glycerol-3-phosphate acyltransferase PlsY
LFADKYADIAPLIMIYTGAGCVLGHNFPFYLKFKGGKGIASSLGFLCVVLPEALPGAIVCFVLVVWFTRYVSLGSILAAIVISAESLIFYRYDMFHFEGLFNTEVLLIIIFLVCLTIFLHRSNIKRLASGNENKFSFHPNV